MSRLMPSEVVRRIGQRVRAAREAARLTLQEVADRLDMAPEELAGIEDGREYLTAEDIVELCPVLNVPPSWFFEGLV